jgi:hypothetical protein
MLDLSLEDCKTKYTGCIMMIDGEAKLVLNTIAVDTFYGHDLRTGVPQEWAVNEKNLKAPTRIGNVQVGHGVAYVSRNATRMWKAGLTRDNLNVQVVPSPAGSVTTSVIKKTVQSLEHKGIALALENEYPSLTVARRKAKQHEGTYAFDRQFAVDCNDKIWYKNHHVGEVVKGSVVFHDSAVSLQYLLGEQNA